jgi:hypothetical protein
MISGLILQTSNRSRAALRAFLLLTGAVLGICGTAWADGPVGIPDVHIGDLWSYRTVDGYTNETTLEFTHRIVKLSDKEIVLQLQNKNVSGRKLLFYTREWNSTDVGEGRFDPFYPEYKFPLKVGDTWNQEFKSSDNHGTSFSSFVRAKIVALEKVTVPAGTFDAYRIERDIESRKANADANIAKGRIITWFAPAVKKYVRRECMTFSDGRERSKTVDELIEYSLQEKSAKPSN